eukprot:546141-Rhodomonas_salina.1
MPRSGSRTTNPQAPYKPEKPETTALETRNPKPHSLARPQTLDPKLFASSRAVCASSHAGWPPSHLHPEIQYKKPHFQYISRSNLRRSSVADRDHGRDRAVLALACTRVCILLVHVGLACVARTGSRLPVGVILGHNLKFCLAPRNRTQGKRHSWDSCAEIVVSCIRFRSALRVRSCMAGGLAC